MEIRGWRLEILEMGWEMRERVRFKIYELRIRILIGSVGVYDRNLYSFYHHAQLA
jgi:hypothetical protein